MSTKNHAELAFSRFIINVQLFKVSQAKDSEEFSNNSLKR